MFKKLITSFKSPPNFFTPNYGAGIAYPRTYALTNGILILIVANGMIKGCRSKIRIIKHVNNYVLTLWRLCNRWHLSVCLLVCWFVCEQCKLKTYWWIFLKFSHIVYMWLSKSWLNFGDVNVTVAYFKATLKLMGLLSGWRSALYECNFLVADATERYMCTMW